MLFQGLGGGGEEKYIISAQISLAKPGPMTTPTLKGNAIFQKEEIKNLMNCANVYYRV